ncbi:cilia- and flagella-associated protein 20-like [Amyelois transitella]|uniref:cilia- and flagella-associated protein 20-like n=1 Tax=Amyelois transitella TaxID=680683 RepID=UPI00298FFB23|nr:cilia- and flagella-associated protein 20-like [Amyelois transitella]
MYRDSYQRGMLTVFFSCGSKPLNIWETHTQDGYISRFLDQDIKSMVLEIGGTNVSTTYMICPKGKQVLGITMPFLVMIVKNLKKYFSFEVTILDETGTRRRFRVSNFQSTTQILPLCTVMPIGLSEGWNQIQFNLAEFTRRAYKKQFVEVQKIKVNANIRLRRIYFTERLIPEDQLPPEYKLYFPLASKEAKGRKGAKSDAESVKENLKPSSSQQTVAKQSSKVSMHSVKGDVSAPEQASKADEPPAVEGPPAEAPAEEVPEKAAEAAEVPESGEAGEATEQAEGTAEVTPEGEIPSETAPDTAPEGETEAAAEPSAEAPAEEIAEATAEATAEAPAEAPAEESAETPTEAAPESQPAEQPAVEPEAPPE